MDRVNGSTDILDMAFISPNLAKHGIQFQLGDDFGSDHLPMEIRIDTSDLDKYADFIVTAISTAVDKAIPKSKSLRPESNPISDETLALIKEKRRLRRQYSQKKDPAIKTLTTQLQKQVKEELKVESLVSWEKFCNSISLETNSTESWRKIKIFLKPKSQRDYPTLHHATRVAKTNVDKVPLFAESVEMHFGTERDYFD